MTTAITKRESPKIELAGVETGAKIFVGLRVDAKCTENPPSVHSRPEKMMKRSRREF